MLLFAVTGYRERWKSPVQESSLCALGCIRADMRLAQFCYFLVILLVFYIVGGPLSNVIV